jgi:hypothetical protein
VQSFLQDFRYAWCALRKRRTRHEGKIAVYFPHQQVASSDMFLVARTSSKASRLCRRHHA